MNRKRLVIGGLVAGLLAGCESTDAPPTSSTAKEPGPQSGTREISASLLATCQEPLARRAAVPERTMGFFLAVDLPISAFQTLTDTLGRPLASGSIHLPGTGKMEIHFASNGKDSTGRPLPEGHYFLFVDIRDSTGVLVKSLNPCLYWAGGS